MATAAFLREWRNGVTRQPATLARIELTSPSAVTLLVGTRECILTDNTVWESGLRADPIRSTLATLGTGPEPADCAIHLVDRAYGPLGGTTLSLAVSAYQWQDAVVTLYLWNDVRDASGVQVLTSSDLLAVFTGTVDSFSVDDDGLHLNLMQQRFWNRPMNTKAIDKTSYPNAPDGSIGQIPPVLYGDFGALGMRSPYTSAVTNKVYQEDSGGGAAPVPLLLVDPGIGGASVKLLAAGHLCVKLLDRTTGYSAFISGQDVLAPLDTTGLTETLGASESYLSVADNTMVAYYGIRPSDVRTGGGKNSATNPRRATDVLDETSFATLDQGAGATRLQLQIPRVSELGRIEAVSVIMSVSGNAANANNIQIRPQSQTSLAYGAAVASACTTTTPFIVTGAWDAAYWNANAWDFGFGGTQQVDVVVDFVAGATNKASIYWVALKVKYRPSRNIITPGNVAGIPTNEDPRAYPMFKVWEPSAGIFHYIAPVSEVVGQFFGNVKGYADTGAFTSGGAGTLIECPPDVVRHMLTTYAAESSFETAAGAFGSFVDARGLLRNGSPSDFKMAARVATKTTTASVLTSMLEQSLCAVTIDRFTGKWLFHVWKKGAAVDYTHTFDRDDCADMMDCGVTSDVNLTQGIRVQFAYDAFRGRTLFESYITADSSSQGYSQATARDQRLVIDATNDKFDWVTGAWGGGPFTFADTLTHATYTDPMDLASDVQTKLRSHISTASYYTAAGYGFSVKLGYNDALAFWYGPGPTYYNTTFPAGDYTPDEFATQLAATMNATAGVSTITVTYEQDTNKLRIQSSGSTLGFQSKFTSHTSPGTTLTWTIGFNLGVGSGAASTNLLASYPRYADRFWMMSEPTATFQLLGWSGANKATGCYGALGWDAADDTLGNVHAARLARGVRESVGAASQSRYGVRPDAIIQADWLRDELSAQQLRDRAFDFGGTPRTWLRMRTHACPDLQRMRVVTFDSGVDARRRFPGYGSDGSWAGKAMRVLEVEQDLGPSYHTEFYAEEA